MRSGRREEDAALELLELLEVGCQLSQYQEPGSDGRISASVVAVWASHNAAQLDARRPAIRDGGVVR